MDTKLLLAAAFAGGVAGGAVSSIVHHLFDLGTGRKVKRTVTNDHSLNVNCAAKQLDNAPHRFELDSDLGVEDLSTEVLVDRLLSRYDRFFNGGDRVANVHAPHPTVKPAGGVR